MWRRLSQRWGRPWAHGAPRAGAQLPAPLTALGSGRGSHACWWPVPRLCCPRSFCHPPMPLLTTPASPGPHLPPPRDCFYFFTLTGYLEDLDLWGTRHGGPRTPVFASTANPVLHDAAPAHTPARSGSATPTPPPAAASMRPSPRLGQEQGSSCPCPPPWPGPFSLLQPQETSCLLRPAGTSPTHPLSPALRPPLTSLGPQPPLRCPHRLGPLGSCRSVVQL